LGGWLLSPVAVVPFQEALLEVSTVGERLPGELAENVVLVGRWVLEVQVFDVPAEAGTVLVVCPQEEQGQQDVEGKLVDALFAQGVGGNLSEVEQGLQQGLETAGKGQAQCLDYCLAQLRQWQTLLKKLEQVLKQGGMLVVVNDLSQRCQPEVGGVKRTQPAKLPLDELLFAVRKFVLILANDVLHDLVEDAVLPGNFLQSPVQQPGLPAHQDVEHQG
jgi:hypothetical protein